KGAQHGILIKNAQSLEKLYQVDTVVVDKTGTITTGKPVVTDIVSLEDHDEKTVLTLAASLEKHSNHPIAAAINEQAKQEGIALLRIEDFTEQEGSGVTGKHQGKKVEITKPQTGLDIKRLSELQNEGKTVVVVSENKKPVGLIAISDSVKEGAKQAIERLHKMKIKTVMLTGDNKKAAEHIASRVGIDEVRAEVLPQDKSSIVKELQKQGSVVAMVGDGINDAPALTQANVGIAMATGTDIAIESADITLLGGELLKVPQAIRLSRSTMRTIKQNLFWAFIYNVIGIPVAGGVLYPFFGIFLSPIFAGLAMAMSSVSVVSNSLLLKRAKI
ncbi:MAG: heavy metal translocating P-type ATPase, partial [Candidatus Levyibacteriota bacterium]